MAVWVFFREFFELGFPILAQPIGGPIKTLYNITSNDRLGISVQPDGTVAYYINYLGASSDPWWLSPTTLNTASLYTARYENEPDFSIAGTTVTIGARNTRLLRNLPEFIYTGDMQKADNSGSLPATVYVRVRRKSLHPLGPPSDWFYASFVRP